MVNFQAIVNNYKKIKNQIFAVIFVNIIALSQGCANGWISPYLSIYLSDDSPLETGKINIYEASWVGAFVNIGGLVGTMTFGVLSKTFGRKFAITLIAFPNLISWMLYIFATNVYYLYVARFLAGLAGGGTFVVIPLFTAEIAEVNIRGTLCTLVKMFCNVGTLIIYIAALYIGPIAMSSIMLVVPITFFIIILFIPETPQFLFKKDKDIKGEESLRFYRNYRKNDNENVTRLFHEELEIIKNNAKNIENEETMTNFKDLLEPESIKGILISIVVTSINPLSGCLSLITYTSMFFMKSGSDFDPNKSSIAVAAILVIGSYTSTFFIDKCRRKSLLIVSVIGNMVGYLIVGIYSYVAENQFVDVTELQFIPILSIAFAIFASSIGIIILPFTIAPEVLPRKVRTIGMILGQQSFNVSAFVTLKLFPILLFSIGLYGCILIFLIFGILILLFLIFILLETKGKNLETVPEITKL